MKLFDSTRDARRFLTVLIAAFLLTLAVTLLPLQKFQVEGSSMLPGLASGERILVEEITPRFARGDLVVFHHPADPRRYLIKRVIGLPGETVVIRGGEVYANGRRLEESYLPREGREAEDRPPVRLGESEYFVLGDQRRVSEDSRLWGPVPAPFIVGRALLAYWPVSAIGFLR